VARSANDPAEATLVDDPRRRTLLRASAVLAGAAAVGALPTGADATVPTSATTDTLLAGHHLASGQSLRSRSGAYSAFMQRDGNFVVYGPRHTVRWASNSAGWTGAWLALQSDGNLVLYPKSGKALYASGTAHRGGHRLTLQNDGNLVLRTAAGKVLWSTSRAQRPRIAAPPKPKPVPTPPPPPLTADQAFDVHVLRRTTYGITPSLLVDVTHAGGIENWLEQQLAPASIPDPGCEALLVRFPTAFIDPPTAHADLSNGDWAAMEQLVVATFARQAWSKRQLFEVMAEFWSNHLNITTPSSEPWATKMWDDRHVIRAHALGRFDDMLVASMKSPAMLQYLSNAQSRGDDPNENYGRELLELHTVGVDAGYGHEGVINAARTLSGFTVSNPWNGGSVVDYGMFRYLPAWHYVGPVRVLDWSHPNADANAGPAAAESLARYLATHPSTAQRIATKLAIRFVADAPPPSLVDTLSQVYLANQTAIIPVLRTLFASTEFRTAAGRKYRRPAEDLLATIRVLGVTPDPTSAKTDAMDGWRWLAEDVGNAPLGWHAPDGYADVAAAWAGAGMTLGRWNAHAAITGQWWTDGVRYQKLPAYLLGATMPTTRGALIDILTARLLPGVKVASAHRAALIGFLGADGPLQNGDVTWLFPVLVAMVLNSPYWSVR
jgi:uncharacterized protein (DUF1800 family)